MFEALLPQADIFLEKHSAPTGLPPIEASVAEELPSAAGRGSRIIRK